MSPCNVPDLIFYGKPIPGKKERVSSLNLTRRILRITGHWWFLLLLLPMASSQFSRMDPIHHLKTIIWVKKGIVDFFATKKSYFYW